MRRRQASGQEVLLWAVGPGDPDGDDDPLPPWLHEGAIRASRDGELVRLLRHAEPPLAQRIVDLVAGLPGAEAMRFVEDALCVAEGASVAFLARLGADALADTLLPHAASATWVSARDLLAPLQARLTAPDADLDPERHVIAQILAEARQMPPDLPVPPQIVEALGLLGVGSPAIDPRAASRRRVGRLDKTQRAFVERTAARLLPHDRDLLHVLLHDADLRKSRGGELIDLHLGASAHLPRVLAVVEMAVEHDWHALERHGIDRLLHAFADEPVSLAPAKATPGDEHLGQTQPDASTTRRTDGTPPEQIGLPLQGDA